MALKRSIDLATPPFNDYVDAMSSQIVFQMCHRSFSSFS